MMKPSNPLLLVLLTAAWWLPLNASGSSNEHKLLQQATEHHIAPQYHQLTKNTEVLKQSAASFCDKPDADALASVRQAWEAGMATWSSLAAVRFGPILERHMSSQFQFWPDDINLVHRKFESRVSGTNDAISAKALDAASVAIQGLSAVEYLLYDPNVGTLSHYQSSPRLCLVLQGTISNLLARTRSIDEDWQTHYPERWYKNEDPANGEALHGRVEDLVNGVITALHDLEERKLEKPLGIHSHGEARGPLNPWLLESWRSRTSLTNMGHSLRFMRTLYETENGLGAYLLGQPGEVSALDQRIRQQFELTINTLEAMDKSAFELLKNGQPEPLDQLFEQVSQLYTLLKRDYAQATGVFVRFNAKGGD